MRLAPFALGGGISAAVLVLIDAVIVPVGFGFRIASEQVGEDSVYEVFDGFDPVKILDPPHIVDRALPGHRPGQVCFVISAAAKRIDIVGDIDGVIVGPIGSQ